MTQQRSVSFSIVLTILLICSFGTVSVSAADLPSNPLTDYKHLTISTANSGPYYIKFDGGGLNALHMTTSIDEPYGQVTSSTATSGTFYISDTGGRGFFNNLILMVAVKPPSGENATIPDDFSVTISSAGYKWEPTGVLNKPPVIEDLTYQTEAMKGTYSLSDLMYGPQTWKPAGETLPKAYPIYSGQDVTNTDESFYFCFIDLKTGNLGENSQLSGLKNNGMAKVRFSINGLPEGGMVALNVYGYCAANQANQGEGISWTNRVSGEQSSGILIRGSASGGDGGISLGSDSGDGGDGADTEVWVPTIGNLNITSSPVSAEIVLDGLSTGVFTNTTLMDLPVGTYSLTVANISYQEPEIRYVTISGGRNTTSHFNLEPQVMPLTVLSSPSGADIFIDGIDTLWHTNTTLSDIPVGIHTITIEKEGYLPVSRNVTLEISDPLTVTFVLQQNGTESESVEPTVTYPGMVSPDESENLTKSQTPVQTPVGTVQNSSDSSGDFFSWLYHLFWGDTNAVVESEPVQSPLPVQSGVVQNSTLPEKSEVVSSPEQKTEDEIDEINNIGSVYVVSSPKNCAISVDGKNTGFFTPHLIYGLKAGNHRVTVTTLDDSHAKASENFWIYPEEAVVVNLNPARDPYPVKIEVKAKHLDSGVFTVCGKGLYYTFPETVEVPSYGAYICTVSNGRYYSQLIPSVKKGDSVMVESTDSFGTVQIDSIPAGADIYIDGFATEYSTPASISTMSEGYHTVLVTKDGFLPEQEEFRLVDTKASVDKNLEFVMEDYQFGTLFINSTPAGANIYLHGVFTGETTPCLFREIPIGTYDVGVVLNASFFDDREVTVVPSDVDEMVVYDAVLIQEDAE